MNPQTLAKLKTLPEFQELVAFLATEAAKLNDLSMVDVVTPANIEKIYCEILARKLAAERLASILAPILSAADKPVGGNPQDFVA